MPDDIANRIRAALGSSDLAALRALLDPNLRWGAPDDPTPSCQSRDQVLAWYERRRASGTRADVTEVVVRADKALVGLRVSGTTSSEVSARWQVLTLNGSRVVDIRAYEDRNEAAASAGVSG